MYSLAVALPLLSALLAGVFGRFIGEKGSVRITTAILALCLILSVLFYAEIHLECSTVEVLWWDWFDVGFLHNPLGLYFDEITAVMLVVVTSISTFVHLYSSAYMKGDPHLPRFMSYLSLFTFFMLLLITSHNLPQLFIGWEGVGLCSYLLINFWFTRIQANKAAIKAMLVNRVGDVGLILGMILIWLTFGTLEFSALFSSSVFLWVSDQTLFLICLFLLIGAIGKSAQLGLHTWLPDAMEGPTPVSALIHAATMVTAGVFLVIRTSPLFELTPYGLLLTAMVGSFTAFFAATVGLAQNDLKKVIAYSTCSQLGYMIMICGLSHYSAGLFHLFNHAFFKALLFLSAGSIIHALMDEQDMRRMGSLLHVTPTSYVAIMIGSISLMGLPFLTGFYSKDLILELTMDRMYLSFVLWLGLMAAFFTAFYSFRLILWTFLYQPTSSRQVFQKAHEGSWNLILPLLLLIVGSLTLGYLFQFSMLKDLPSPMITSIGKWTPTTLSILGGSLSLSLFTTFKAGWRVYLSSVGMITYSFINAAWQFNYVINHFLVRTLWALGLTVTYNRIDRQLLEHFGPEGVLTKLTSLSSKNSLFQSGQLMNYILVFAFFLTVYVYLA
uniref:NADH-ubiquinone oxidoreductase chain 5 n=1 Tax=Craspedacusta sowerbii TaxID=128124 RepID=J7EYV6_CRASO|nr:NADH dehydrogenase subunit 5 [Craspedacusta sowerbii]AEO93238.1 NADH dehydrogenase subunit 5 [Craspedacusta sowerbii]